MENKQQLIEKYEQGLCSEEEVGLIEQLIEKGEIDPLLFKSVKEISSGLATLEVPSLSADVDSRFYRNLLSKSKKPWYSINLGESFGGFRLSWGMLAYSIILLGIGYFLHGANSQNEEVLAEMESMKEMMMLTLIEEESTSDRLRAVSLTSDMTDASDKIIKALLKTLSNDPNSNVRLSALEVLLNYTEHAEVREGLVMAIPLQDSHMLQVALAEVMVGLQEKSSVDELKTLIGREDLPDEVKERVQKSIDALI